jgi:pseudaminic acid cytidylyltransferase
MENRKSIAIITARGGSKRIPKKNIRSFCGRPILSYSIDAALQSGLFDEVMVSTDSEEIAGIAKEAGAQVPFLRSTFTSGDFASSDDVLREVLQNYASAGRTFDVMCCLYPTAPFITAEKLQQAYGVLETSGADSVMPVTRFSYPPQRAFILREGLLQYQFPQYENSRSQDLEPIYHDCGQFYFYRVRKDLSFECSRFAPLIVPDTEVQDIDNEDDWKIAEVKYRTFIEDKQSASREGQK